MINTSLSLALLIVVSGASGGEDKKKGSQTPKKTIRIQCKQDARLRGAKILLQDIAEVSAPDAARTKRLMGLSFGQRPNSNHNRILTRQDVLARLFKEGFLAKDILIEGAKEIVVHPLSTAIEPSEIIDIASPALEAALGVSGGNTDVEYKVRSRLRSMRVPPGRRSLDMKAQLQGGVSSSSARINISILVDNEVYKVVPVHYQLTRFHRVLVTRNVLRKDTGFGSHNLILKRVAKPLGSTVQLTSLDQVKGRVSARDLRAGRTLTLGDLAMPAVVRKKQIVTLISMSGRVKAVMRVRALEDGVVGAFIRVQTMHSRNAKLIVAKVHGPGVCVTSPLR